MGKLPMVVLLGVCAACGGDDATGGPDAAPLVRADRDHVLSHYTLPAEFEHVEAGSFEFPNSDGAVNNLGTTIVALIDLLEGIPVQADFEAGLEAGAALQGMRVHSAAPEDDPEVSVTFSDLIDVDDPADPSDDFGGEGQFEAVSLEPYGEGTLEDGTLDVSSDTADVIVAFPLILGGEVSRVHGTAPRVRVELTDDGFAGAYAAAITVEALHADVYPAIASLVNRAIAENTPKAPQLRSVFDGNSDGTVTVAELQASPTLQQLTRPDLDLDGDGAMDHLSVGMPFEGVRAEFVD